MRLHKLIHGDYINLDLITGITNIGKASGGIFYNGSMHYLTIEEINQIISLIEEDTKVDSVKEMDGVQIAKIKNAALTYANTLYTGGTTELINRYVGFESAIDYFIEILKNKKS